MNIQEKCEYDLLQHIKFCLECKNESQAIRLIEKYGFQKQKEMYSEEDLKYAFDSGRVRLTFDKKRPFVFQDYTEWKKQFKKK